MLLFPNGLPLVNYQDGEVGLLGFFATDTGAFAAVVVTPTASYALYSAGAPAGAEQPV